MAFLFSGQNLHEKILFFSLVDGGTCKNNEKMFLLTGKSSETFKFFVVLPFLNAHFHSRKL